MNAQEKITEYAHKHNTAIIAKMTDLELAGMMVKEGVVISRTPTSRTIARIRREGNEIIITETTKTIVDEIVDGKIVSSETSTTIEIDRFNI